MLRPFFIVEMPFYIYILKSDSSDKSYIGHSKDLDNRVAEHNNNKNKATRNKGPWRPVFHEVFDSRSDAMKREKHLKTQIGRLELKSKEIL